MNRLLSIISILSAVLFISCAKDRSGEYEELTQHNIWMYEQMKDKYLWGDDIPEQEWKNYFSTPSSYFSKMIGYGDEDCGSYIIVDSLKSVDNHSRGHFNHKDCYGFDFKLITDPTNATTKYYARILTVYDDSPAQKAGLKRDDWIETYDGYKLSKNNESKLEKGSSHTFVVRTLGVDSEGNYVWTSSRNVSIDASTYVEDKPFPICKTFTTHEQVVGYLMCNRLTENAVEKPDSAVDYKNQMDQVMQNLCSAKVNELILDLRLCNFGTLEMARRLASYIIPSVRLDKVFAKTIWNSNYTSNNQTILFDSSLANKTLELDGVIVLTSNYTKGAAEWLIKSLQSVLGEENVMIVGEETCGQYYMTQHIGDYDDMIHLYPAVAFVNDENTSSTGSITPTHVAVETDSLNLYDYGDIREPLLSQALYYMYDYVEPTDTGDDTDSSTDTSTATEIRRYKPRR